MSITNEQAEATVRTYLGLVATGTADEIAALYAEDATLEDPVGSDPLHGRDAIRGFYATIESLKITTELLTIRTAGGEAAFHFHISTDTGAGFAVMQPMEVMTFDEAGLITTMRAWWNDGDLTFE
ncbi:steroid delta-isomerase [Marmoricola sp. OAE513]|uniref:nuclear transport factor 2 family protein n=1 Tax=Marmoricola sp. OAE513 TaxID=2817894 RepID=UPI001AEAFAA8